MARSRGRSRGSSLPAIGGTLGSLVRSTLAQAGAVRDVLERGAREGKARLDDARRERRREQALARLGEAVLDALHAGEAQELLDRAEVADAIAEVDDLDRGERDRDRAAWVAPPTRERYDRGDDDGTVSSRAWRPPARPARPDGRDAAPARPAARHDDLPGRPGGRHDDDARPRHDERSAPEDRPRPGEEPARAGRRPAEEPGARFQERRRAGGIQFDSGDDEDDLAEFMHPDDLPPRTPKGS